MLSACCLALTVLFGTALVSGARAQDRATARLVSDGACLDGERLEARIDRLAGRDAIRPDGELALTVDERVARDEVLVTIAVEDATGAALGSREIDRRVGDCDSLLDAVALVLAMTLDLPAEEVALHLPPPRPEPEPEPSEVLEPPPPPPDPRPFEPRERWRPGLAVGLRGGLGTLPRLSLAPAVGVELSYGPWRIRARVQVVPPQVASGAGEEALVRSWSGDLQGCFGPRGAPASVEGCVGLGAGRAVAEGRSFVRNLEAYRGWASAGVELALRLTGRAGHAALRVALGAEAPLPRRRFAYLDASGERRVLVEHAPVAGYLQLALVTYFGAEGAREDERSSARRSADER